VSAFALQNPWPNITYDASQNIPDWSTIWTGTHFEDTDPLQEAANYYLLFGLSTNAFVRFEPLKLPSVEEVNEAIALLGVSDEEIAERSKYIDKLLNEDRTIALESLRHEADDMFQIVVDRIDGIFREYMHLAIGGELRHHKNIRGVATSPNRREAWSVWKTIIDEYGVDALLSAAKLFRDFPSGSYGGEPWAVAAELLHAREVLTLGPTEAVCKSMFVDRVFTLEHNTGCFLNKLQWANLREGKAKSVSLKQMPRTVLDYQHSNPPRIADLWHFASTPVQHLVKAYLSLASESDFEIMGVWDDSLKAPDFVHTNPKVDTVTVETSNVTINTPTDTIEIPEAKLQVTDPNTGKNFSPLSGKEILQLTEAGVNSWGAVDLDFRYIFTDDKGFKKSYSMDSLELFQKKFYLKHQTKKTPFQGSVPTKIFINVKIVKIGANLTVEVPSSIVSQMGVVRGQDLLNKILTLLN
jgi:hypothetical protein